MAKIHQAPDGAAECVSFTHASVAPANDLSVASNVSSIISKAPENLSGLTSAATSVTIFLYRQSPARGRQGKASRTVARNLRLADADRDNPARWLRRTARFPVLLSVWRGLDLPGCRNRFPAPMPEA